jgi:hypothetical protein
MSNERNKVVWGTRIRRAAAVMLALLSSSCSEAIRTGQSPAYLVMTSLTANAGGQGVGGSSLSSDVISTVNGTPTIVGDTGSASFQLVMKDPQAGGPSDINAITITQYHVQYTRSDGRNVQGVDVPWAFDGVVTQTISGTGSVGFTLVRNQAKAEAPLQALARNEELITTVAEVTFYGHDQNGREISVSGRINVTFGNFGA